MKNADRCASLSALANVSISRSSPTTLSPFRSLKELASSKQHPNSRRTERTVRTVLSACLDTALHFVAARAAFFIVRSHLRQALVAVATSFAARIRVCHDAKSVKQGRGEKALDEVDERRWKRVGKALERRWKGAGKALEVSKVARRARA